MPELSETRLDEVLAELEARPHPERAIACPYCQAQPGQRCGEEHFLDDPEMQQPIAHSSRIALWKTVNEVAEDLA